MGDRKPETGRTLNIGLTQKNFSREIRSTIQAEEKILQKFSKKLISIVFN